MIIGAASRGFDTSRAEVMEELVVGMQLFAGNTRGKDVFLVKLLCRAMENASPDTLFEPTRPAVSPVPTHPPRQPRGKARPGQTLAPPIPGTVAPVCLFLRNGGGKITLKNS